MTEHERNLGKSSIFVVDGEDYTSDVRGFRGVRGRDAVEDILR